MVGILEMPDKVSTAAFPLATEGGGSGDQLVIGKRHVALVIKKIEGIGISLRSFASRKNGILLFFWPWGE